MDVVLYQDGSESQVGAEFGRQEASRRGGIAKRSDNVVKLSVSAGKSDQGGNILVTAVLAIDPEWHLYANAVGKDFPGIPTTLSVTGPIRPEDVKVDYPQGKLVHDEFAGDHFVYEGTVTIKAIVHRAGAGGPLEVSIKLQACNKEKCLLPATIKQTLP
jgi:DsbC/DsbD-like thiol-disulfide interchange protein